MRFWLSRETPIPIREQLSAQLLLGILGRRLLPGERLPSVRALSRRLQIHANTISAVYQDLVARGWLETRRGSGVFVRSLPAPQQQEDVDAFVRGWAEAGLAQGFSVEALQAALARLAAAPQARRLVVVDPDLELARVLAAEIAAATDCTVLALSCEDASSALVFDSYVLVNSGSSAKVRKLLPDMPFRTVPLKSMQDMLSGHERPVRPILVAVVSRSESILRWASTLLSALGSSVCTVLLRDPQEANWQDGLAACDVVAVDVAAWGDMPDSLDAQRFEIIADEFLGDMRELVTVWKVSQGDETAQPRRPMLLV